MEKLGVDSEQFFTLMPTLSSVESEMRNKELEQVFLFLKILS
jgi:hypothetical protein